VSARFYGIVVDGESVPSLWAPDDPRGVGGAGDLCARLEIYELLQELHRLNPRLTLQWRGSAAAGLADLEDLPRLSVTRAAEPADVPSRGFDVVLLDAPADPAGLAGLAGEAVSSIAPGGLLVVRGSGSRLARPAEMLGGGASLEPVPLPDWGLETCRVFRSARGGEAGRPGLRLPASRRRGLIQRARPLLRRLLRDRSPGGRR
jgi:hypothetical protein